MKKSILLSVMSVLAILSPASATPAEAKKPDEPVMPGAVDTGADVSKDFTCLIGITPKLNKFVETQDSMQVITPSGKRKLVCHAALPIGKVETVEPFELTGFACALGRLSDGKTRAITFDSHVVWRPSGEATLTCTGEFLD